MTILYSSDFDRYPDAIIDLETKNKTWVEFAGKLKAMGVENWGFHLTLLDPSLQGVDPHDPNLDELTILKIQYELRYNWWYYPREVFRLPAEGDAEPGPLHANRGNIAAFWCLFNHFITYMQQLRQTGKSLFGRCITTGFHTAWTQGSNHVLFTKSDLRPDEIKNYKLIKELLPSYMWYNTTKDKDNQQDFTTLCHRNTTFSYIPSSDEEGANKVGRGKTPRLVLADEVPFLKFAYISLPALLAATGDAFEKALAQKAFHGIVLTTTAGDLSTPEGKYVYEKIKSAGMFFSEILYDCLNRKDALATIFANSTDKVVPRVTIAFNHLQLGYTDEWLKIRVATATSSKDQIKRDFLGIWTFGSQENPIDAAVLAVIRANVNHTPHIRRYGHYLIRFHKPVDHVMSRKVVLGLDTSELIGRDGTTGVGIDVETTETLLSFSIGESNLFDFGRFLAQFLAEFTNMTLIPEAKSSFAGIRDQLLIELPKLGVDPGRRIYNTVVDNAKGNESDQREYKAFSSGYPSERKYYPYRNDFGFKTGPESRRVLMKDVMLVAVNEVPTLVRDAPLIDELSTLVLRKGRIDHALSGHDDHVISWSLAHWLLRYGRNLEHYGIDTKFVMSRVRETVVSDPAEIKRQNQHRQLLSEVDFVIKKLEASTSVIEASYYESRLNVLRKQIKAFEGEDDVKSMDGRARSIVEQRRHNAGYMRPIFGRGR